MKIGAYGVKNLGETAQFGGISGGQQWLAGSSEEIQAELGPDVLRAFFPELEKVEERSVSSWPNQDGVFYILANRNAWYVVHTFQPRYSIARSIPLWLCVLVPGSEMKKENRLASIFSWLNASRQNPAILEGEEIGWFSTLPPESGHDLDIEDLRAASEVFDSVLIGRDRTVRAFDDEGYWRGMQLVIGGLLESLPPGEQIHSSFRLEPSGVYPKRMGTSTPDLELQIGSEVGDWTSPLVFRGVNDADWFSHMAESVGISNVNVRDVVRLGIQRWVEDVAAGRQTSQDGDRSGFGPLLEASREAGVQRRFCDYAEPPLGLVPPNEISADQSSDWGRAVWRINERMGMVRVDELCEDFKRSGGVDSDCRRVAALLVESPASSSRSADEILKILARLLPESPKN